MALDPATLPNDIAALKALLIAADARAIDLDGQIAHIVSAPAVILMRGESIET